MTTMLDRFQGVEGERRLLDALMGHPLVQRNPSIARRIIDEGVLTELAAGTTFIEQGNADNDVFFIISGEAHVVVNGRYVATRGPSQCVGEMAAVDATARRSATLIAKDQLVAIRLPEPAFSKLMVDYPEALKTILSTIAERLRQRAAQLRPPNPRPVLFIGSSVESLAVAREIQSGLQHDPFDVVIWTDGVFGPSGVPIDELLARVDKADFAVLVLGPDDQVTSRSGVSEAPRDNVILELGLFMGQLGRARTFMVKARNLDLKIPTDLIGVTPLEYQHPSSGDLTPAIGPVCTELRKRMQAAGSR